MRRHFIIFLSIFLLFFTSCSDKAYMGTYVADESEYYETLKNSRGEEDARIVIASLKSKFGSDWNKIVINRTTKEELGDKEKIKLSGYDLYVDISDMLKELEAYIGAVASDISKEQKWGSFSDDWNTITTISGFKYYKVK